MNRLDDRDPNRAARLREYAFQLCDELTLWDSEAPNGECFRDRREELALVCGKLGEVPDFAKEWLAAKWEPTVPRGPSPN